MDSLVGGENAKLKGGVRRKMFVAKHCAPDKDTSKGSCLDEDLIIKIAKILNKKKKITINLKLPIDEIHNQLLEIIQEMNDCDSEACILTMKDLLKKLGKDKQKCKNSFRPIMPDDWDGDDNAWLSTDEIEDSLKQYEKTDEKFYFYGAVPIDFSNCSVSNLCSFNLKKHIKKGDTKIGIVFNTDPHTQKGQHWISLYVDLQGENLEGKPCVYYFDSYGRKPPQQIHKLIQTILKQGEKYNHPLNYFYNDHCYQNINAQCGMYSIHFVKRMLEGLSFRKFLKSGLNDKKMIHYRNQYFIDPNELK
jgi:hypothetical protein